MKRNPFYSVLLLVGALLTLNSCSKKEPSYHEAALSQSETQQQLTTVTTPYPLIGSSTDGLPGLTPTQGFDDYQTRYNGMAITRIYSTTIGTWPSPNAQLKYVLDNAPKIAVAYSFVNWNDTDVFNFMNDKPNDGHKIYLIYHHEPTNDANGVFTSTVYKANYQKLRKLWVDAGKRTDIVLTITHLSAPNTTYDNWWPGTVSYNGVNYKPADVVTFDLYNPGYDQGFYTNVSSTTWVGRNAAWAMSKGCDWGITEMGAAIGPAWAAQTFNDRLVWLQGYLQYCVDNGAKMVICWDRPTLKKWLSPSQSSNPDYTPDDQTYYPIYGSINKADYRMGLNTPLKKIAPSPQAGNYAYPNAGATQPVSGTDITAFSAPHTEAWWRGRCINSRTANGIPAP